MSEPPKGLDTQSQNSILGPDYFGFYLREVGELFAQGEDALALLPDGLDLAGKVPEVSKKNSVTKNRPSGSTPLFSEITGSQLSDFAKERLKALVRQSLFTFTKEVDSILASVLGICRVQSILKYKESLLKAANATEDASEEQTPQKKRKVLASVSMDEDLRLLLDSENSKVEEMAKKHSAQLLAMIEHMRQNLQDFVDLLLSNFRLMTLTEKQKLQKQIQNLPPRNLDRVVEIIQQGRPFAEEMHVDLEEQSKVTLWRLYFYIEAVENARKLCEV